MSPTELNKNSVVVDKLLIGGVVIADHDSAEVFSRNIQKNLRRRFGLVQRNQTAAANFFLWNFVDDDAVDFILREPPAGVLGVSLWAADLLLLLSLPGRLRINNVR